MSVLPPASNIVPLRPASPIAGPDPLGFVERYWTSLRKGNGVPARSQIDPRDLKPVLQQVFILERVAPGMARFRIAGADLARATGMELRGLPISAIARPQARGDLAAMIETCFGTPAVTDVPIKVVSPSGRGAWDGAMLLLPMTCDGGTVSRALGAAHLPPEAMIGSGRLDVSWHVARPVVDLDPPEAPQASGFAEPRSTFQRPKLTLVHSTT